MLFLNYLVDYFNLSLKSAPSLLSSSSLPLHRSFLASFSMPDVLTKWWALFLFTLQVLPLLIFLLTSLPQITCIFISINVTNVQDTTIIFVTIVVCGLNLLLVRSPSPPPPYPSAVPGHHRPAVPQRHSDHRPSCPP
jgi:hypothetical protein